MSRLTKVTSSHTSDWTVKSYLKCCIHASIKAKDLQPLTGGENCSEVEPLTGLQGPPPTHKTHNYASPLPFFFTRQISGNPLFPLQGK